MLVVVTMGQGSAERYIPGANEICISITTPGCADAQLSPAFLDVLRLAFVDYPWEGWRECASNITPDQADRVVAFLAQHAGADRCVIHCTVGASRSVSMAMALEDSNLATYEKPAWWHAVERREGSVPNRGVYARTIQAARRARQVAS